MITGDNLTHRETEVINKITFILDSNILKNKFLTSSDYTIFKVNIRNLVTHCRNSYVDLEKIKSLKYCYEILFALNKKISPKKEVKVSGLTPAQQRLVGPDKQKYLLYYVSKNRTFNSLPNFDASFPAESVADGFITVCLK